MNNDGYLVSEDKKLVWVVKLHCPECFSTDLKTQHSEKSADGSVTRATKCKACGWNFVAIIENPEFG